MADLLHFQSRVSPRVPPEAVGTNWGVVENKYVYRPPRVRSANEIRKGDRIFLEA